MHKEELTRGQSLRGFVLATVAFLAIFAATAVPIPLYADYQATIGLTTADISNTMFTYLIAVTLTLLFAGRISDAFGRTPITSLTLMLVILGCVLFMSARSGADVLLARFVQGLSAGLGMSAVSALVIDCVGERHLSWGSAVASCGSMFGIMLGSVGVGVLYGLVPNMVVVYGTMIAVLAACLFLMPVIHEPLDRTVSLRAAVRPRIYVPRDCRLLFAVVCVCYLGTWLVSCYFQSFAAPIAYSCFGATSPLAGSIILALVMAPAMAGGPLVQKMDPRRALVLGMAAVTVSAALMALCIAARLEVAFMAVCALFSVASGVCVAVALRMLLLEVSVLRVSAILSSVNLVAYAGSALTGAACGALLEATSYATVFAAMALVLVGATLFVAVSVRKPRRHSASKRLTLRRFYRKHNPELVPADEPRPSAPAPAADEAATVASLS